MAATDTTSKRAPNRAGLRRSMPCLAQETGLHLRPHTGLLPNPMSKHMSNPSQSVPCPTLHSTCFKIRPTPYWRPAPPRATPTEMLRFLSARGWVHPTAKAPHFNVCQGGQFRSAHLLNACGVPRLQVHPHARGGTRASMQRGGTDADANNLCTCGPGCIPCASRGQREPQQGLL